MVSDSKKEKKMQQLTEQLRKPKTKKGHRFLKNRESKVNENPKNLLVIKGAHTTDPVRSLLSEIGQFRKPLMVQLDRRQAETPFDNVENVEYLCKKNDTSLFCFGSASKKRPFRLVLGRMFEHELLDMQEFKVTDYKSMHNFASTECPVQGSKPLLIFQGAAFDHDEKMKQTKSLLMDTFRGPNAEKVSLMGLKQVFVFSAVEDKEGNSKVVFRHYRSEFKKTGTKLPHVDLAEAGPRFTLAVDRVKTPMQERWKMALKTPKELKPKKQKNVTTNMLGQRIGRVHVGRQDFDKMHTVHHGSRNKRKFGETRAEIHA